MQWRRQRSRLQNGLSSTRLDERHAIEPADFVFDSDGLVKRDQVGAGAEEHMLAVVYDFTCARMLVRRSAPAEVGATLEQNHTEAAVRECARGGQSRQTSSDNCHR